MDATKNIQPITKKRPSFWKTTLSSIFKKSNEKSVQKQIKSQRNFTRADKNN